MSDRNLEPGFALQLAAPVLRPAILVMLAFRSATRYIWSGTGTLNYSGQSYMGVGSVGSVGVVQESSTVKADGTTVTLSGIDPVYLSESLEDVRLGGPAKIWLAAMTPQMTVFGAYQLFSGTVDQPKVTVGGKTVSITLALENRLVNHSRASYRRYTSADQRRYYPDDTGFDWIEQENDKALRWGS